MPSCSVPGCSSRRVKGVKVFMARFPSDPKRKDAWIRNIGKDNWQPTMNSIVCQSHFAKDMWEKQRVDGQQKLKCNAVPTIFPNRSVECSAQIDKTHHIIATSDHQTDEKSIDSRGDVADASSSTSSSPDIVATFTFHNIPQLPESTKSASSITASHLNGLGNEDEQTKVKVLKKQLEEANRKLELANRELELTNRKLELANQILESKEKSRIMLKKLNKKLIKLTKKWKDDEKRCTLVVQKTLTDDQIEGIMRPSRGYKWSNDTTKKALQV